MRHWIVIGSMVLLCGSTSVVWAEESYHGFDIEALAKASSKHRAFRDEYGDQDSKEHFEKYLKNELDVSEEIYWEAYQAWWSAGQPRRRNGCDPTHRLPFR